MSKPSHLYVHLPFCASRCSYCAFYSICDLSLMAAYFEALKIDLSRLSQAYSVGLKTLYFGGGNPALLGAGWIGELVHYIRQLFGEDIEEITLEANPENIDEAFALAMRELGVNRISMGVQSFDNRVLDVLGRSSRAEQALRAFRILRSAGFRNINLDLIYGSPRYSLAQLEYDLKTLVKLSPEHISAYALQVEEGTSLKYKIDRSLLHLPSEELLEEQFDFVIDYLSSHGYKRYEISNYAKEGYESGHNLAYWNYADTLGAGAAAVYTYGGTRVENVSSVKDYIDMVHKGSFPLGDLTKLSLEEEKVEFIMMNMRKANGLSRSAYLARFASKIEKDYGSWIEKYRKLGLMEAGEDSYYLTARGLNVSNSILAELL